jgi:hypothetical protein
MPDNNGNLIAPLQSFFVTKRANAPAINHVKMHSGMTTTKNVPSPYALRSATNELQTNLLRILATQEKNNSAALLRYKEDARPGYDPEFDVTKAFFDETPLAVYTLTPSREALAITASGDFLSWNVPIGLRYRQEGQVTLNFSGLETFGHKVYLIDNEQRGKDREIDLQKNPSYSFIVRKSASAGSAVLLEDRFSLRMEYTGIGLDNESMDISGVHVSTKDGYIYVQSDEMMSEIRVYNISGATVHSSNASAYQYRIRADRGQTYVVRVKTASKEYNVQKTFVY